MAPLSAPLPSVAPIRRAQGLPWYVLIGRYVKMGYQHIVPEGLDHILFVLGLAGSLAAQRPVPATDGTLPTHRPLFVSMLVGVVLIVVALTYFPALALGPLAEGITR